MKSVKHVKARFLLFEQTPHLALVQHGMGVSEQLN